jgi:simple sugar transport system ATP-binding protein
MISHEPSEERKPILQCFGITKRFGGLVAVDQVSLEVFPGEVVGLVGDNGAGKSTLIHMISGVYRPDEGQMYLDGQEVKFASPMDARERGIETIFQDLALCNNMNASDNIFLGREQLKRRLGFITVLDRARMREESERILKELDIIIPDLQRPIRQLSGGQRQAVAISRSVYWNARLLIMDEPTAALGVPEQRKVKELVHKLKERHVPIIMISHNMQEVFSVADRVIVMRRGHKVADLVAKETNGEEIVSHMVGKDHS